MERFLNSCYITVNYFNYVIRLKRIIILKMYICGTDGELPVWNLSCELPNSQLGPKRELNPDLTAEINWALIWVVTLSSVYALIWATHLRPSEFK